MNKRITTLGQELELFNKEDLKVEPVSTQFPMLDKALGGGLIPGLTYLGAEPGLGKSTFAFQLACNIAEGGRDVIICSLEMQKRNIVAKLISRNTFRLFDKDHAVSANRILNKNDLSEEESQIIEKASGLLSNRNGESKPVIGRLYMIDGPMTVDQIIEFVNDVISETGKNAPKPVVMIDYLQKIDHPDVTAENERKAVENDIVRLNGLANEKNLCVFVISSLNRGSYSKQLSLTSFKETGLIEYSADTLIGLQYRAVRNIDGYSGKMDSDSLKTESARSPRDVELVVLKQRYGRAGVYIPFDYYAEFDCFVERSGEVGEDAFGEAQVASLRTPRRIDYTKASLYINNTKLWYDDLLRNEPAVGKKMNVIVGETKDNEKVSVSYTVDKMSEPLGYFDAVVSDAVYSVYLDKTASGEAEISLGELLYRMTGNRIRITAEKKRILWKSLYRLAAMEITINCETENKERGLADRKNEISGALLNIKGIDELFPDGVKDDSVLPTELVVCGKSPLFEYAEPLKQIIKVPVELMNAGEKYNDTEKMIMMKHYLVKRLENLRVEKDRIRNPRIAFVEKNGNVGDIMKRIGTEKDDSKGSAWLHKLKKAVDMTGAVLDHYVEICYINNYNRLGTTKVTSVELVPAVVPGRKRKVYVYDHKYIYPESKLEEPIKAQEKQSNKSDKQVNKNE